MNETGHVTGTEDSVESKKNIDQDKKFLLVNTIPLLLSVANVFSGARNPFKISQEFYTDFSCDFKLRLYRKLYKLLLKLKPRTS